MQEVYWIVSGFIGLLFGVVGGYITYRLERKRDDIKWAREKEQLEATWKHDKEQMELVWQQKLQELEIQFHRDEQIQLRQKLLNGTDNLHPVIEQLLKNRSILERNDADIMSLIGFLKESPQFDGGLMKEFEEFLKSTNQSSPSETLSSKASEPSASNENQNNESNNDAN